MNQLPNENRQVGVELSTQIGILHAHNHAFRVARAPIPSRISKRQGCQRRLHAVSAVREQSAGRRFVLFPQRHKSPIVFDTANAWEIVVPAERRRLRSMHQPAKHASLGANGVLALPFDEKPTRPATEHDVHRPPGETVTRQPV
jgi:hypothetical protein